MSEPLADGSQRKTRVKTGGDETLPITVPATVGVPSGIECVGMYTQEWNRVKRLAARVGTAKDDSAGHDLACWSAALALALTGLSIWFTHEGKWSNGQLVVMSVISSASVALVACGYFARSDRASQADSIRSRAKDLTDELDHITVFEAKSSGDDEQMTVETDQPPPDLDAGEQAVEQTEDQTEDHDAGEPTQTVN